MGTHVLDPKSLRNGDHAQQVWRELVQGLLESLLPRTESNYALFRTLDNRTGRLIMECMAPTDPARQLPQLCRETFWIPREKDSTCLGVPDPVHSWGVWTRSENQTSAPCAPAGSPEQAFADWVEHKAWFPVCVGNDAVGLVILLRGVSVPYRPQDVARAWLSAQDAVSLSLRGDEHTGFCTAVAAFNVVGRARDERALHRMLARSLASRFGLQWHRVWLFQDAGDGTLACRYCLGELNKERWSEAVAAAEEAFASLEAELAAAGRLVEDRDGLARVCCNPDSPLALADPGDLPAPPAGDGVGSHGLLREAATGAFASAWGRYQEGVAAACERLGVEFHPDTSPHYLTLTVSGRRWVVVLSQAYDPYGTPASCAPILTTCYLHHAARVVSEWDRNYHSPEGAGGAGPPDSLPGHLADYARKLAGRYSATRT